MDTVDIAFRVYSEARGQEYTDTEDIGYFRLRENAERAASDHAAKANKEAEHYRAPDGRYYLNTTPYTVEANGEWRRLNHMGDVEQIIIEEIRIQ